VKNGESKSNIHPSALRLRSGTTLRFRSGTTALKVHVSNIQHPISIDN